MPSAADLLIRGLGQVGTPRLFGVPGGGSNLELLAAARSHALPFVLCHQESAACLMAAVTGELTGTPGAALATLGPGATSAANGVAYALLDRAPLILFTDRHPDAVAGFTTHQRLDHAAVFAPLAKESLTVTPESAAQQIARAVRLALTDPCGPVHLDVPADVAARESPPVTASLEPPSLPPPEPFSLDRAAALIKAAARPVLVVGLQCGSHEESKWLRAFAESLPAPVLTTYKAKGVLPDSHPLALGLFTGGAIEEAVLGHADLIITLGLDTVELIPRPWPYQVPVVHFTRMPHAGHYFRPAVEVVGDLGLILEELAPRLRRKSRADWDMALVDRLKRERRACLAVSTAGLAPQRVVEIARELAPGGTVATVDAGAHMFPATTFWESEEPGTFLISNGLSSMGFALPAAIAAQLAYPSRRVVCLAGDGGLLMVAAELETAVRLRLPIVIVVFNDRALSLIQVKQEQKGYGSSEMSYTGPDFAPLARSFGMPAFEAETEEEFRSAMSQALAAGAPALVDARIDASGYRQILETIRGAPRA